MNIYITRHGQTKLNKDQLMQGRYDEPLSEVGIAQAEEVRKQIGDIKFDAVYSSPLKRALKTACIITGRSEDEIIKDERIIEVAFGEYELKEYHKLGPRMTLYWMYPEIFPAPKDKGVEDIASMVKRSRSFLEDLKKQGYENVLVVCHGGIIRALCGVLENRFKGIKWRPKPKNCEVRKYTV